MSSGGPRPPGRDLPALRRQAAAHVRHPQSLALLTLTFSTGVVDAISYLGLGKVFTANMTGNVVLLGFGLAGTGGLPVLAPLVSLAAFMCGAATSGAIGRGKDRDAAQELGRALAIECAVLSAATLIAAVVTVAPAAVSGDVLVALLAFALGARNATVRRIGVPDLTTTVLTLTLTGLAADAGAGHPSPGSTARRACAAAAMLVGALTGALLLKTSLVLPLALAAVLALGTAIVYLPRLRQAGATQE
jgi:uncharacterized membrane protein YoaK (UPF0700 family)